MAKEEEYYQKIAPIIIISVLLVLSVFVLRPIILSIIFALIFAFIFSPVFDFLYKKTKSKNFSLILILGFIILLILFLMWMIFPLLIPQAIEAFQFVSKINFVDLIKPLFPASVISERFTVDLANIFSSFTRKIASNLIEFSTDFILNIPIMTLHLIVMIFTFFFILKEKEKVVEYVRSIFPFSKKVEEKVFRYTKGITSSFLYGQIIIGIIQGTILGLGLFIFGVPNALMISLLAVLMGILPILGTTVVWIPLTIYLLVTKGPIFSTFGVLVFGIFSSTIDNFLRPLIVSKRVEIHPTIILISMVGGLFFLGILGIIIGPLIISYLIILLGAHKENNSLIRNEKEIK